MVIEDDFSPSIGGTGAGTLTLNNVSFLDNNDIAGTVTLAQGVSESGIYYLNNISFDRGVSTLNADGEIWIGSGSGNPAPATITAGTGIGITNAANSITLDVSATTALSFPTDSGTATPAANALTVAGGTGITTSGAAATVTVTLDTPVAIADGGTNATSFTQGSVIFMGAAALSQDNSNLFWDDTNNRLGIGTTTPLDNLYVVGAADIVHTATENDDHALEIECDAAGFGDVKGLDIDYISGAVGAGDEEEAILVNIDETASTGGVIKGYEVLSTEEGSAVIYGYSTGINIAPVLHNSGTFGDADDILNVAVDVTAALASGGAGAISIFVLDNDTMTIGDAAQFGEMEIILATGASGAGIAPTFEYSTGGTGFSAFSPSDGTNAFRNTGSILWDAGDLAGWVANATGFFEIRITRTRNSLSTTPIIDELQISALTEFIWDKDGDVNLNSLTLATPLAVAQGGSGRASHTAFGVICGGTTTTAAQQSIASVGTAAQVLTSNGAGALPTFQAAAGGGDWILISTATASDSATIEFNNLSSTYIAYKVIISSMAPVDDGSVFFFRTSTDNGVSFDSGVSDYSWAMVRLQTSATENNDGDAADSEIQVTGDTSTQEMGNGTNETSEWEFTISDPSQTTFTFISWFGNFVAEDGVLYHAMGGGNRLSAADVDAIQFSIDSGNISTGNFALYGVSAS